MFIVDLLSAKYHLILTTSLSSYYPHFTENWDTERWNNLPQIMKLVSEWQNQGYECSLHPELLRNSSLNLKNLPAY